MSRERHLIADNRQRAGECWLVCTCSFRIDGDTPEDTAAQFTRHRSKQGERNTGTPRSTGEPSAYRVKPRVGRTTAAEEWGTW